MEPKIKDPNLSFTSKPPKLNLSALTYLVQHHQAGNSREPEDAVNYVHNLHLNRGWWGIGYGWYIPKDGTIYLGRGYEYQNAHVLGYNEISLGICYQGDLQYDRMTDEQLKAGIKLNAWLIKDVLPNVDYMDIVGHSDLDATICPGPNFRMEELREGVEKALESKDWRIELIEEAVSELGRSGYIDSPDFWKERVAKLKSQSRINFEFHMLNLTVLKRMAKEG